MNHASETWVDWKPWSRRGQALTVTEITWSIESIGKSLKKYLQGSIAHILCHILDEICFLTYVLLAHILMYIYIYTVYIYILDHFMGEFPGSKVHLRASPVVPSAGDRAHRQGPHRADQPGRRLCRSRRSRKGNHWEIPDKPQRIRQGPICFRMVSLLDPC